ncbi:MAG TPA: aconitase X, partial [Roseomonas sp.]
RKTRDTLSSATGDAVDVVAFGSPHCSLTECRQLATLMQGRRAAQGMQVFITTSRAVRELLGKSGDLEVLEAFGAEVTADTCIVVAPLVKPGARVLMTNSAKYAHYGPGLLGVGSVFGSTEESVESAVQGRVVRDESAWN